MAVKESRKVIFKLSSQEWMEPALKMPRKNFPDREEQAWRIEKCPGWLTASGRVQEMRLVRYAGEGKSLDFILNTVGIHEKVLHWERHDDVLVLKDHFSCCIAKPVKKCSQISIWEITVTLIRAAVGKMHRISSKLYLRCRTSKTGWDLRGEWKGGVNNDV